MLLRLGVITSFIVGTQVSWFLLLFAILMVFLILESLKKNKADIQPWESESINTIEDWHERENNKT